jgi:hypothetical protein
MSKIDLPLDVMIIHGYELNKDQPTPILCSRLDYGLELFRAGYARNIIVAGKHAKFDKDYCLSTGITESAVMKKYLVIRNAPAELIFEEPRGTNTFDCTKYAFEDIIKPHEWESCIMISNSEHVPRISLQSNNIFPNNINIFYSGVPILDPTERKKFIEHEIEGIEYALNHIG